jgi:lipoyl(octanoyl) transferase
MSDGWTMTSVGARHAVPLRVLPTVKWHLIIDATGRPGADNMARDAALLLEADRTGAAFLRLYRWDPPCLSLGRNEPALEGGGIATVRRPTGGRAVWHEHEVTYAVAAPIAVFGRLRHAYRAIHERLAAALRSLGADVTLAGDCPAVRPSDGPTSCFATSAGGEILAQGRKLVGSAQVRHGSAFLQHGSILLDGSQDIVRAVSRQPSAVSGGTTLRHILGRSVGFEEVCAAILATWGEPLVQSGRLPARPAQTTPGAASGAVKC